jgi:hypothetical protein
MAGLSGLRWRITRCDSKINLDVAEHAGLKISSKRLVLAKSVIGVPKGD